MTTPSGVNYNPGKKLPHINSAANYSAAVTNVFITLTADHVGTRATAGGETIGVMVNKPNTGEPIELIINGTAPIVCGDTVSAGDIVKSDGIGEAVVADTDKDFVAGIALQGGVNGDIIEILLVNAWAGV